MVLIESLSVFMALCKYKYLLLLLLFMHAATLISAMLFYTKALNSIKACFIILKH